MSWIYILSVAVIVEGIISYISMIITEKKIHYEVIASIGLGITIALSYGIDLFKMINIKTTIPYIGCILTGILISRGSNYVYDLQKKIIGTGIDSINLEKQYDRPIDEINKDTVNHEV